MPTQLSKLVPRRRTEGTQGRRPPNYPDLNFQVVAQATGLSSTFIGRVLNGKMRPSMETAQKLAAYLGWSLERIANLYGDAALAKKAKEHKRGKGQKGTQQNGKSVERTKRRAGN